MVAAFCEDSRFSRSGASASRICCFALGRLPIAAWGFEIERFALAASERLPPRPACALRAALEFRGRRGFTQCPAAREPSHRRLPLVTPRAGLAALRLTVTVSHWPAATDCLFPRSALFVLNRRSQCRLT